MTIWILALLLLASLAGLGYRQGAIRVAFSFVGILFGALLASPLSKVVKPILVSSGVKSPVLLWLIPPLIVFVIILAVFKLAAQVVHHKVEVHYKYHAGELLPMLWERLNRRVGLCLGLLNGAAYFVLLIAGIYMLSYWTYQFQSDSDPKLIRLVNQLGKDMEATGMTKVARALDRNSPEFYQAADIAGLIYQNPLLEARLSRYPAFLGLAERPEFQTLGSDNQFTEMRQRQASIAELLDYPAIKSLVQNPDSLKAIKAAVIPNLTDLGTFLSNGVSAKFTEPILGRWDFDVNASMILLRKARPKITSNEMRGIKRSVAIFYSKATFIAAPEPGREAFLKNMPKTGATQPGDVQTMQGQWKGSDGSYTLSMNADGKSQDLNANVQGDRLTISGTGFDLAFSHED
jgi:uncharacterized membrane protein required for colicin V production